MAISAGVAAEESGDDEYPTIAFLISAFNAERYIDESLQSALTQTYPNLSVWVLDDGSTDSTWDRLSCIADPRLHVLRSKNRGKPASMNDLLDRCDATYFAMQDADDISSPDRAEVLVRYMEQHPGVALVLSGHEAFIDERRRYRISRNMSDDEVSKAIDDYLMPALDPTMAGRVDIARATRFNPSFRAVEGVDFVWRVGEQHRVSVLPDVLYRYRVHAESTTQSGSVALTRSMGAVMAAAMSRRTGRVLSEKDAIEHFRIRHDSANNMYGTYALAVRSALATGDRREAIRVGVHSARRWRLGHRYFRPLAVALGGDHLVRMRERLTLRTSGREHLTRFKRSHSDESAAAFESPDQSAHR